MLMKGLRVEEGVVMETCQWDEAGRAMQEEGCK